MKKYKVYTKILNAFTYPSRILKFKRTKWFNLKGILQRKLSFFKFTRFLKFRTPIGCTSKYLKRKKRNIKRFYAKPFKLSLKRLKIYNKFKIYVSTGRFLSLFRLRKSRALLKLHLKNVLHLKNFSSQKSFIKSRDKFLKSLYSDAFSLHGVFSYFYFIRSYRELHHLLKNSSVFLNENPIYKIQKLKRGDIIQLKMNKHINVNQIVKSFVNNYKLPSHLEIDFYTQTIILLKDQNQSSSEDYTLSTLEYINGDKL